MSKKSKKHSDLRDVPVAVNYAPVAPPTARTFWRKVGIAALWQLAVPVTYLSAGVGFFLLDSPPGIVPGIVVVSATVLGPAAAAALVHRSIAVTLFVLAGTVLTCGLIVGWAVVVVMLSMGKP